MIREVDRYLREDGAAGRLVAHAQLLARLEQRLRAALPGPLATAVRIGNFRDGKAVVLAENGAAATKVRQLGQRLANALGAAGVTCDGIEVKVAPRGPERGNPPGTVKPLSTQSFEVLRSTAEKVQKSPLRAALDQLLARVAKAE